MADSIPVVFTKLPQAVQTKVSTLSQDAQLTSIFYNGNMYEIIWNDGVNIHVLDLDKNGIVISNTSNLLTSGVPSTSITPPIAPVSITTAFQNVQAANPKKVLTLVAFTAAYNQSPAAVTAYINAAPWNPATITAAFNDAVASSNKQLLYANFATAYNKGDAAVSDYVNAALYTTAYVTTAFKAAVSNNPQKTLTLPAFNAAFQKSPDDVAIYITSAPYTQAAAQAAFATAQAANPNKILGFNPFWVALNKNNAAVNDYINGLPLKPGTVTNTIPAIPGNSAPVAPSPAAGVPLTIINGYLVATNPVNGLQVIPSYVVNLSTGAQIKASDITISGLSTIKNNQTGAVIQLSSLQGIVSPDSFAVVFNGVTVDSSILRLNADKSKVVNLLTGQTADISQVAPDPVANATIVKTGQQNNSVALALAAAGGILTANPLLGFGIYLALKK